MAPKEKTTKEHVLRALEARAGESVSGGRLAEELSVSRAAVWKAIEELRSEGYRITAVTNRGYALDRSSDHLSPQGIAAHLRHSELAPTIYTYDSLESTNLTAKQMAVTGAPHGTVIAAATQTAGRGRLGRSFYSPKQLGVYFSTILRPESMAAARPFNPVLITTAASVAVARAIEELTGKEVQIKWVNDLYLEGKKICGILTEGVTNLETGAIESIVVGIGINCFEPEGEYPEEIKDRAAALFHPDVRHQDGGGDTGVETGAHENFTKNRLIAAVIDQLMDIQSELHDGSFIAEYKYRSFILGKEVIWYPEGGTGTAVDIDPQGGLVLQLPDGTRRTLSTGEISIRPANPLIHTPDSHKGAQP